MKIQAKAETNSLKNRLIGSVPNIEDGQGTTGSIAGGLLSAGDINDQFSGVSYYGNDYVFNILSWSSAVKETGDKASYDVSFSISIYVPLDNRYGFYGYNLVKEGDILTVYGNESDNDYVEIILNNFTSPTTLSSSLEDSTATATYFARVTVTKGDPGLTVSGDTIVAKNRLYQSNENLSGPSNLISSSLTGSRMYFTWTSPENTFYSRLKIRPANSTSNTEDVKYVDIPGNYINGQTASALTPLIGNGSIKTVFINNAGNNYSTPPELLVVGDGSSATAISFLNSNGSLRIDDYKIVRATYQDASLTLSGPRPTTGAYLLMPNGQQALVEEYEQEDSYYRVYPYTVQGFPSTFSQAEGTSFTNQHIQLHNGVYVNNIGNGYSKAAINIQQLSNNASFYYNPDIWGVLQSGDYYWSVCSIFDEDRKTYSNWSDENLITIS